MKGKKILIGIMLALVLIGAASIFLSKRTDAQEADQSGIMSKLDQILSNEKILVDQITAMRQEINIIKIRVTQSQ